MNITKLFALLALVLTFSPAAAQTDGPPLLAMVTPQSAAQWVAIDNQTVTTPKPTRAGSRITVAEDGVAYVGLPGAGGSLFAVGGIDEQGAIGVGGTDYSQLRAFSLASGLALYSGGNAVEPLQLNAGGRLLSLQRASCLIRVRGGALMVLVASGAVVIPMGNGNPVVTVAAGQSVTVPADATTAKPQPYIMPGALDDYGLGRNGRRLAEVRLGGPGGAAGRSVSTLFQLFLIAMFAMQMVQVVYPKFGDRAVLAACVALALEAYFGMSRLWLKYGETPLPAGAFLTGLAVLGWVVAEEHARNGRTTVRIQFLSHISKCVLVWVLSLLIGHGAGVFNPSSQANALRMPRTQTAVSSTDESPIVTTPAQNELQAYEALGMILPAFYLMAR